MVGSRGGRVNMQESGVQGEAEGEPRPPRDPQRGCRGFDVAGGGTTTGGAEAAADAQAEECHRDNKTGDDEGGHCRGRAGQQGDSKKHLYITAPQLPQGQTGEGEG